MSANETVVERIGSLNRSAKFVAIKRHEMTQTLVYGRSKSISTQISWNEVGRMAISNKM